MLALVEIAQLGKTYETPAGPAVIVRDFTLYVDAGEFVCLLGHSGCGKTTVLSILMGLVAATTGGVVIDGREVDGPGADRGVVFQSATLLPWMSVAGNVRLALDQVGAPASRADSYLASVGLAAAPRRPAARKTVIMVTHDVDEALLLADRIVMMTNGPAATIGRIFDVPFPRPRRRDELLARPDYFWLRDSIVAFLEEQAHATA